MAQFITTTFSGSPDVGLQLGNEEWVRKLAIGSTWTHVRIGVLYQITGTANTPGGSGFAIGMCSGTSAPFGNASTTNFVGIECVSALTFSTASLGANYPYYPFSASNIFACKKVVATITTAATNLADGVGMNAYAVGGGGGVVPRRSLLYVDITKGSPNYTIGISSLQGGTENLDITVAQLLTGMIQNYGSINIGVGIMHTGNGAQTLACDETAGGFDSVNIYSNELGNPLLIFEVAVEKLA
jgi:hypothetical protein